MKMKIKEFANYIGVSVRTLHYYDKIGLLKPSEVDKETGYRYYDNNSILRMQEILFYRELDFPLKTIEAILKSPDYDKDKALMDQKQMLILKKERLERLIDAIDGAVKGENIMKAFDSSEFEKYKEEAKERWGETDAYKEHSEKTKEYSSSKWNNLADDMNNIIAEFAEILKSGAEADSQEAQNLVAELQKHITDNYYNCTNEILGGLGQMYVADERFKNNMDKHGEGTAEFVSKAIGVFVGR